MEEHKEPGYWGRSQQRHPGSFTEQSPPPKAHHIRLKLLDKDAPKKKQ
jgi:hypothetical protein